MKLGAPDWRGFRLASWIAVALLLGLAVVSLLAPIVGEHHHRQSETYSVARNFLLESADFFHPRVDHRDGLSGIMGMELPLLPYLSSFFMRLAGDGPQVLRVVGWLLMLLGACAGYLFVRRARGTDRAVAFALCLALSPSLLFEGRQILPDGPMLGMALLAARCFHRHGVNGDCAALVGGLLAFSLAVLLKAPALLLTPAMWLFSIAARPVGWKRALARAAWFVLPVVIHFAWQTWAQHLDAAYAEGHGHFIPAKLEWAELRAALTNGPALRFVYELLLPSYASNWCLGPLVLLGACLSWARPERRLALGFWAWLAAGLSLCTLFSAHSQSHWYDSLLSVPPLAYFGALGISFLWRRVIGDGPLRPVDRFLTMGAVLLLGAQPFVASLFETTGIVLVPDSLNGRTWASLPGALTLAAGLAAAVVAAVVWRGLRRRVARWLLAVAGAAALAQGASDEVRTFVRYARFNEWAQFDQDWEPLRAALAQLSPDDERIVTDTALPWTLYLARRRGYTDNPPRLNNLSTDELGKNGVRLFVHFPDLGGALPDFVRGHPIASGRRWEIYCIATKGSCS